MTYAQALTLRDSLEASLLSGAGVHSATIGDKSVTFGTDRAKVLLSQLNRDIQAYKYRASNLNPRKSQAIWR